MKPPHTVNRTPLARLWRNGNWLDIRRVCELSHHEVLALWDSVGTIVQASAMFPLGWLSQAQAEAQKLALVSLVRNGALSDSDDPAYDAGLGVAFASLWEGEGGGASAILLEISH
jgi:hypothetical protein